MPFVRSRSTRPKSSAESNLSKNISVKPMASQSTSAKPKPLQKTPEPLQNIPPKPIACTKPDLISISDHNTSDTNSDVTTQASSHDQLSRTLVVTFFPNSKGKDITDKKLMSHFDYFKEVIECAIVVFDSKTNNYGYITFKSRQAAKRAQEMYEGSKLDGKFILRTSL